MRRVATCLALLLVPGGVLPAAPSAIRITQPDISIRAAHAERWVGDDRYYLEDLPPVLQVRAARGWTRAFELRVENDGNIDDSISVEGSHGGPLFDVTYLAGLSGSADITDQVVGDGYPLGELAPGEHAFLRLVVTASQDAPYHARRMVTVGARSVVYDNVDRVRASVEVVPIRSSAINLSGRFRCIATFPDGVLRPGYMTRVRFKLKNITDRTLLTYSWGFGWLTFRNAEGEEVWNTDPRGWRGTAPLPHVIPPGGTLFLWPKDARIRWSGPLTIEPHCEGVRADMPPVRLPVAVPGETPQPADAIAAAVDASDVFEVCAPPDENTDETGVVEPPLPGVAPMPVRCWAEVRVQAGFDHVTLFMVFPQDAPSYEAPTDPLRGLNHLPGEGSFAAVRWDWVVTDSEARAVHFASQARTSPSDSFAPYVRYENGEWSASGAGRCGYLAAALSRFGQPFMLDWAASCPDSPEGAASSSLDLPVITRGR